MKLTTAAWVIALLAALGATAGFSYWLGRPGKIVETAAPAIVQADGSIIAERAPDAKAKPKQKVPRGAKVERISAVTVTPPTPEANLKPGSTCEKCPPVTIDTTLTRLPDGSKRVLISSPDGRIDRAVDIPVESAAPPPEPKKWAVGLSYSPTRQTSGIWIERDIMRARIGVDVFQTRQITAGPTGIGMMVRLGVTW